MGMTVGTSEQTAEHPNGAYDAGMIANRAGDGMSIICGSVHNCSSCSLRDQRPISTLC